MGTSPFCVNMKSVSQFYRHFARDAFSTREVSRPYFELIFALMKPPQETGCDGAFAFRIDVREERLEAGRFGVEVNAQYAGRFRGFQLAMSLV